MQEIERKFLIEEFPDLPLLEEAEAFQGYLSVEPVVRIRKKVSKEKTSYVLCFKGEGTLSREEIETDISPDLFEKLRHLIGKPLIAKLRRSYALPGGLTLEVNEVDSGLPGAFFYAEIEYPTEEAALSWRPDTPMLQAYLSDEVTGKSGASMGEYWNQTRK